MLEVTNWFQTIELDKNQVCLELKNISANITLGTSVNSLIEVKLIKGYMNPSIVSRNNSISITNAVGCFDLEINVPAAFDLIVSNCKNITTKRYFKNILLGSYPLNTYQFVGAGVGKLSCIINGTNKVSFDEVYSLSAKIADSSVLQINNDTATAKVHTADYSECMIGNIGENLSIVADDHSFFELDNLNGFLINSIQNDFSKIDIKTINL